MPPKHTAPSARRIGGSAAGVERARKGGFEVKAVRCAYGFHSLHIGGRASVSLSQIDRDVFGALVVGVAAALGKAVAALKGVLARGEVGSGVRGEGLARAEPGRPIDATLHAERARHGFLAANDRGEKETALDKDGPLSCGEGVTEFGAVSEPERAVTETAEESCPFLR